MILGFMSEIIQHQKTPPPLSKEVLLFSMELLPGFEPGTSTLPTFELLLNKTRTQNIGNPYISCVFSYSQNSQLLSIFKNLTTVDNKSPILTHPNTHFCYLKSSKLA